MGHGYGHGNPVQIHISPRRVGPPLSDIGPRLRPLPMGNGEGPVRIEAPRLPWPGPAKLPVLVLNYKGSCGGEWSRVTPSRILAES